MKDPESKTAFFREVSKKIAGFELEVERENYIEAIAEQYHTSFEGLRKMVLRYLMQGEVPSRPEVFRSRKNSSRDDGIKKSQRMLLTWLTEYQGFYQTVKAYIRPEDFTTDFYREVAGLLFEQLENGQLEPAKIIDHFMDQEEQREAAELFHTKVPVESETELKKAMKETVKKVMEAGLEQQNVRLDTTDMAALQQMLEAKRRLQNLDRLEIRL